MKEYLQGDPVPLSGGGGFSGRTLWSETATGVPLSSKKSVRHSRNK